MDRSKDIIDACRKKIKQLTRKIEVKEHDEANLLTGTNVDTATDKADANEQQRKRVPHKEDYVLADVRRNPTIEDDVVLIFLNSMMECITESCVDEKYMEPETAPSTTVYTNSEPEKETEQIIETALENSSSSKKSYYEDEYVLNGMDSYTEFDRTSSKFELSKESSLVTILQMQAQHYTDLSSQRKNLRKRGRILRNYDSPSVPRVAEETVSMLEQYTKENGGEETELPTKILEQEEIQMHENIDWRISFPDQDVFIIFKQGNTYEGHISRKLMEGYGKFQWTDGTSYEGNFEQGEITGKGKITFSDLSWYEGEFYHGIRHGKGFYVSSDNNVSYYGHWYLGKKHGRGAIYYGDKQKDYYSGEFLNGERHGYGSRQYSSGARYFGEWRRGLRHGFGTMVFPNNDVYIGDWANGLMHGQGEYIWNAFVNKTFAKPTENIFRGNWINGLRCGRGTILRTCGANIFGEWVDDKKHGPGIVVCYNGSMIRGNPLFMDDNLAENPNETPILNPSLIIQSLKPSGKEGVLDKSSTKRNKKGVNTTFSLMMSQVSKSRLGPTSKKVNKSRIVHRSRGHPIKINLHDSNIELSYHLIQLLKSMGKSIPFPTESQNAEFELNSRSNAVTKSEDDTSTKDITFNIEMHDRGENSDTHKEFNYVKDTSSNYEEQLFIINKDMVSMDGDNIFKNERDLSKTEEQSFYEDEEVVIQETNYEKLDNITSESQNDDETKKLIEFESKWLTKVILLHSYDLQNILSKYSKIACKEPIEYKTNCLRIMLWQLERDCGFNERGFSLIEVDERVAQNSSSHVISAYDPFEKLEFYQFLHYLLELSWMLYASKRIGYEDAPGILASAFVKLVNDDILPNTGNHKGTVLFKYLDVLPLDAVYSLYKSFGEPHTARKFLTSVCIPRKGTLPDPPPSEEINPKWYPEHIRNGKNAIYLANNIVYLPGQEPLSYSSKQPLNWNQSSEVKQPIDPYVTQPLCLRNLGPKKVIELLAKVCPLIKSEDLICNIDYELTFLEFYEVLLLCAECSILKDHEKAAKAAEVAKLRMIPSQPSVDTEKVSKSRQGSAKTPKKKKRT